MVPWPCGQDDKLPLVLKVTIEMSFSKAYKVYIYYKDPTVIFTLPSQGRSKVRIIGGASTNGP